MLRKGFTLIELLIVITIIAILAGAAIPYVADYVDEGRAARAKQDMSEIRNALVRWELERDVWAEGSASIEPLVGPFLSQLLIDPWGSPYVVEGAESRVRSYGPDGVDDGGANDDLNLDFRPPMAVTKVEYSDVDGSGTVNENDTLTFYCTRPVGAIGASSDIEIGGNTLDTAGFVKAPTSAVDGSTKKAIFPLDAAGPYYNGNAVEIVQTTLDGIADRAAPANYAKVASLKLKSTGW